MRQNISRVCFGIDIYLISVIFLGVLVLSSASILGLVSPGGREALLDSGIYSIVVTSLATVFAYIYFDYSDRRYGLAGEDKPLGPVIFERNRCMTPLAFAGLIVMLPAAQLVSSWMSVYTEAALNYLGYTSCFSPAAVTDYTATPAMLLYSVVLGPLMEELVFRGLILRGFMPCGRTFAIVAAALFFSLMHADATQLFFTFLAGLVLGFAATEYSIVWAYVLHVFNNGALGVFLAGLMAALDDIRAVIVYAAVLGLSLIAALIVIGINMKRFVLYLASEKSARGALRGLCNKWFLIFLAYSLWMTFLSLSPIA